MRARKRKLLPGQDKDEWFCFCNQCYGAPKFKCRVVTRKTFKRHKLDNAHNNCANLTTAEQAAIERLVFHASRASGGGASDGSDGSDDGGDDGGDSDDDSDWDAGRAETQGTFCFFVFFLCVCVCVFLVLIL